MDDGLHYEHMDHRKIVYPEFLNDHGTLFGGYMLKWVDEYAYITVCIDYPDHSFVTIALDNVHFQHAIHHGDILRFTVQEIKRGRTSVSYGVEVFGEKSTHSSDLVLFATNISFVSVDETGQKVVI